MAKKSVTSTTVKKSYGSAKGPGKTPAASGKGMDPCTQSDHAAMTKPGEQKGKY
jgi:hypothetical protein